MAIEKMSTKELRLKVEDLITILDAAAGNLPTEEFDENVSDEEVNASIIGAMSALNAVGNLYLGGMDEENPEAVTNARNMDAPEFAAMIINAAVGTYHKFFVEDGDEQ